MCLLLFVMGTFCPLPDAWHSSLCSLLVCVCVPACAFSLTVLFSFYSAGRDERTLKENYPNICCQNSTDCDGRNVPKVTFGFIWSRMWQCNYKKKGMWHAWSDLLLKYTKVMTLLICWSAWIVFSYFETYGEITDLYMPKVRLDVLSYILDSLLEYCLHYVTTRSGLHCWRTFLLI